VIGANGAQKAEKAEKGVGWGKKKVYIQIARKKPDHAEKIKHPNTKKNGSRKLRKRLEEARFLIGC